MCLNPHKIEIDLLKITKLTLLVADSGGGALGEGGGDGGGIKLFHSSILKGYLKPFAQEFL